MFLLFNYLSQFGIELILQVSHQLLDNLLDLLVIEGGIFILQQETDGIAFLSGFEVLALIDIEEFNLLEQLFLALVGNAFNLSKLHLLVNEQGQVALHGRELGEFLVAHLGPLNGLHQFLPVEIGIEDLLVDVHRLKQLLLDDTEGSQTLASTSLEAESSSKDILRGVNLLESTGSDTQATEDVHHVGLEFIDRAIFVRMRPGVHYSLTRYPKSEVILLTVGVERMFGILAVGPIVVAVTELEEAQVSVLTVGVVGNSI